MPRMNIGDIEEIKWSVQKIIRRIESNNISPAFNDSTFIAMKDNLIKSKADLIKDISKFARKLEKAEVLVEKMRDKLLKREDVSLDDWNAK